jgi:ATP/maltotriose-dependent transcriptional regulator MalT
MSLLPIVLFILGVAVLIGALKMGNPTGTTSPEMLATLKGLAGVKRELNHVQRGLREAEARMEDHELRILRGENSDAEIRIALQSPKSQPPQQPQQTQGTPQHQGLYTDEGFLSKPQVLPEKYRWVLELSNQGWSVAEIAGHLAISQDAVHMVLKTSQRGGHS